MTSSNVSALPPGLAETEISIFANARATDPQSVKLGAVLTAIQDGRRADKITKLRALLARGDGDAYDAQKKKLSGVTLSGSFSVRNAQSLLRHSGLLQVDLDHLPNPEEVRDQLAADPHVCAAFLSPSAQGCKAILRIPSDPERHKQSFLVADRYLRKTYGLVTDPSCKDVSRMMFVSHDPELRTNPNAVPLDVEGGTEPEPQPSFDSRRPATPQAFDLGELPTPESPEQSDAETAGRLRSALEVLSAEDYEPWIRMGHALKGWNGPGAFDLWHEWSARASAYKDPADCRNRWQGFRPDSGIDESAVFRAATEAGAVLEEGKLIPHLRFSHDAQPLFVEWLTELEEVKLRNSDESPVMLEHLGKFRSLMPGLALVFHLVDVADGKASGPVSLKAAGLAAGWGTYLESHARRIYGMAEDITRRAAGVLAEKIRAGRLEDGFTARIVRQKNWSLLTEMEVVKDALAELVEAGWLRPVEHRPPKGQGGKTKVEYLINPKVKKLRTPRA